MIISWEPFREVSIIIRNGKSAIHPVTQRKNQIIILLIFFFTGKKLSCQISSEILREAESEKRK